MNQKILVDYQSSEGKRPFNEWFYSRNIDNKTRARILIRLNRLSLGNPGDCEPVGGGVFELKIDLGPGYRIYFAYQGSEIVILISGGDKSTQKKDIQKAIEYWIDLKRRTQS